MGDAPTSTANVMSGIRDVGQFLGFVVPVPSEPDYIRDPHIHVATMAIKRT